jgi:hypothetical protein
VAGEGYTCEAKKRRKIANRQGQPKGWAKRAKGSTFAVTFVEFRTPIQKGWFGRKQRVWCFNFTFGTNLDEDNGGDK